jgi:hypothetical protein
MAKVSNLQYAIGKAAEKPLVNPRKRGRPAAETPPPAPDEAPVDPEQGKNGGGASGALTSSLPGYRIGKQPISAFLPLGYRQRIRIYQVRFADPPLLADIMAEALDDFFLKYNVTIPKGVE